jgi:hypothetical protein
MLEPCGDCGVPFTEPMFKCTGCSASFAEVGIVLAEPVDFRVRRAFGPQVQACRAHCHLAVAYWYHIDYQDYDRPATQAEITEYQAFLDRLRVVNPAAYPRIEEEFRQSLQELSSLPEEEGGENDDDA